LALFSAAGFPKGMHRCLLLLGVMAWLAPACTGQQPSPHKAKLPRPQELDSGIAFERDPATGELRLRGGKNPSGTEASGRKSAAAIRVRVNLVEVACNVFGPDGNAWRGLSQSDFRVFEDGVEQRVSYFDASSQPASLALVLDASPSVLRESSEMKQAAHALVESLSPLDEIALVAFSFHTYVELPFSRDRETLARAIDRVDVRGLFKDVGGSNIYEAVYLTAQKLFPGRGGRKAIVLLTDGQDSGLGLTLDPSSMGARTGQSANRLAFEDVVRALSAASVEVYSVSTQNRPRVMTPEWIETRARQTLIAPDARELGIPAYTLFLAELVRRAGGQLYFIHEAETLADTYRKIAENIRSQYTLGYYPSKDVAAGKPDWRSLRVEVVGRDPVRVIHRTAYYAPANSESTQP
jgi:Ca-activated chloride channel family protein